jgi:predicted dehydrogenase
LEECLALQEKAKKSGSIVAVCHVLRYTPYFKKLKSIVETGALGDLVSVDHFEPVGYWHMAHSYVRGNWRKESESSFMLLAKSCHDMDILRWLVDQPCKQIVSFGSLRHFKAENAPPVHSKRCIEDCKAEPDCPYSALKVYLDMNRKGWPVSVITEDLSLEGRMKALKEGPYGRCVYHCDNDVVDHQVVSMRFENDVTVNFTMSGFTPQEGMGMRQTRLMGTKGYLEGDMKSFRLTTFNGNKVEEFRTDQLGGDASSGHGGGDRGIITNFVDAIQDKNPKLLTSTIDVSIESHIMAFKGEESRKTMKLVSI